MLGSIFCLLDISNVLGQINDSKQLHFTWDCYKQSSPFWTFVCIEQLVCPFFFLVNFEACLVYFCLTELWKIRGIMSLTHCFHICFAPSVESWIILVLLVWSDIYLVTSIGCTGTHLIYLLFLVLILSRWYWKQRKFK